MQTTADWPHYSWERDWECSAARAALEQDFRTPKAFADDLYDVTPQVRTSVL